MRPDISAAVESLRRTGRPELRQLIDDARLDGPAPAEVLAERRHPGHEDLRDWLGRDLDPEAFDVAAADAAMRARTR